MYFLWLEVEKSEMALGLAFFFLLALADPASIPASVTAGEAGGTGRPPTPTPPLGLESTWNQPPDGGVLPGDGPTPTTLPFHAKGDEDEASRWVLRGVSPWP